MALCAWAGSSVWAQQPDPGKDLPLVPSRQYAFRIPFTVDGIPAGSKFSAEVQLHVSEDRGGSWKLAARVSPDQREFKFQAPKDGEYWFLVRTKDATGQLRPDGPPLPQMRVLVDTQLPQLSVKALRGPNGDLSVKLRASDAHLQLEGAKITYQNTLGEWRNVAVEALKPDAALGENVFVGESTFYANDLAEGSLVRAEVRDQVGNLTVEQARVESSTTPMPVTASNPPSPTNVAPPPTNTAANNTSAPATPVAPSAAAPTAPPVANATPPAPATPPAQTTPPAQATVQNAPQPTPPAVETVPAPTPKPQPTTAFSPVSNPSPPATPNGELTPPNSTTPPPQMPAQFGQSPFNVAPAQNNLPVGPLPTNSALPPGLVTPPLARPPETQVAPGPVSETLPAPPPVNPVNTIPNLPANNVSSSSTLPDTTAPNSSAPSLSAPQSTSPDTLGLPPGVQPRWVNSRKFEIEYDVSSASIETLAKIEMWLTRDGGQTWALNGLDDDRRSPHRVVVNDDGVYGFRMVVETVGGLRSAEPRSGDMADVWIGIDTVKPTAQLLPIDPAQNTSPGQFTIRWQAEDARLGLRPVTLSFGVEATGPWSPIASGLDNTGRYDWRVDARIPSKIYLRLEVRDEAGNVTSVVSAEPVSLEYLRPKGKILNVRPVALGKQKGVTIKSEVISGQRNYSM